MSAPDWRPCWPPLQLPGCVLNPVGNLGGDPAPVLLDGSPLTSDLPALSAHVVIVDACFHGGHTPQLLGPDAGLPGRPLRRSAASTSNTPPSCPGPPLTTAPRIGRRATNCPPPPCPPVLDRRGTFARSELIEDFLDPAPCGDRCREATSCQCEQDHVLDLLRGRGRR